MATRPTSTRGVRRSTRWLVVYNRLMARRDAEKARNVSSAGESLAAPASPRAPSSHLRTRRWMAYLAVGLLTGCMRTIGPGQNQSADRPGERARGERALDGPRQDRPGDRAGTDLARDRPRDSTRDAGSDRRTLDLVSDRQPDLAPDAKNTDTDLAQDAKNPYLPDLGDCPVVCSGGCSGGWCVIQDPTGAAVCPTSIPCEVRCLAPKSCPSTVTCGNAACIVRCGSSSTGNGQMCGGAIDCSQSSSCQINCLGPKACSSSIQCGTGTCDIACGSLSVTYGSMCGGKLSCGAATSCTIDCLGSNTCSAGLDCGTSSTCAVSCQGGSSCSNVLCGAGSCSLQCTGAGACGSVNCAASCACDLTCSGSNSCATPTCPSGCVKSAPPGCTSATAGCDTCP
jgi:hypothetical protein